MDIRTFRNKLAFLFCCAVSTTFAVPQGQNIEPASGDKEISLAGNIVATAIKGTTSFMTRPEMLKAEALIACSAAIYGLGRAAWNRLLLAWMERDFMQSDDVGIVNEPSKVHSWALDEFPTAGFILENRQAFVQNFTDSWVHLDVQQDSSQSWHKNVVHTIDRELTDLETSLKKVEGYVFFPSRVWDRVGINKSFVDSCKRSDLRQRDFHMNRLTYAQETLLDDAMQEQLVTKSKHWFCCCPNFGKASKLYWELKKRIQRLKAIKAVLGVDFNQPRR